MTARLALAEEQYLRTSFDGPEPDYVDGELVERGMPILPHAIACGNAYDAFRHAGKALKFFPLPEIRVRVAPGRVGSWTSRYGCILSLWSACPRSLPM